MFMAQYLKALKSSGLVVVIPFLADVSKVSDSVMRRFAPDPTTGERLTSPVGNLVPVAVQLIRWSNTAEHGIVKMGPEISKALSYFAFVFSDKTWRSLDKVVYVGSTMTKGEIKGATAEKVARSWFALGTMSRTFGISGSFGNFYYHPPSRLGKSLATSVATRGQLLNDLAKQKFSAKNAEKLQDEFAELARDIAREQG